MTDLLNDFINAAASDCVNAHIAPEPIEAPEPRPVEQQRDLVREEALLLGCLAMAKAGGWDTPHILSFREGVEAYEQHLSRHDYRGRR
jgi:hypothetical protein